MHEAEVAAKDGSPNFGKQMSSQTQRVIADVTRLLSDWTNEELSTFLTQIQEFVSRKLYSVSVYFAKRRAYFRSCLLSASLLIVEESM
jgi:hypothetical protein